MRRTNKKRKLHVRRSNTLGNGKSGWKIEYKTEETNEKEIKGMD